MLSVENKAGLVPGIVPKMSAGAVTGWENLTMAPTIVGTPQDIIGLPSTEGPTVRDDQVTSLSNSTESSPTQPKIEPLDTDTLEQHRQAQHRTDYESKFGGSLDLYSSLYQGYAANPAFKTNASVSTSIPSATHHTMPISTQSYMNQSLTSNVHANQYADWSNWATGLDTLKNSMS